MNEIQLTSRAEKHAEEAEKLQAFSGLKLLHVKRQVASILGLIGRGGLFDEYTKHDISHINGMLQSLEWIIPKETQKKLTPSDWLMIVLSVYFHDLGMLVTKDEFKEREKSIFSEYRRSILNGDYGLDYRNKVINLDKEQQDRFIYQEVVREMHAERIKYWILDENSPKFPRLKIVKEIKDFMSSIDHFFRRDLALICESHHLSDLDDFDKYKPNQQYGPSEDEVVNLSYAALILRTADLLHITSDRTPSIEFHLINPTDPLSQKEWAKQKAVRSIRPQVKKNSEGMVDESIPKDTFEVTAFFEDEKGFFGLISYINYANKQLKENFKINETANKLFNRQFDYPWKNIDDSLIETKDFEKKQLEFVLDQPKILDLLVGHTLYNDSTIVLRELTQNAIDACKLKELEYDLEKGTNEYIPEIVIQWDEKNRQLFFIDNGTGMTLDIIQNHLLKVGSSRYQDESFKKRYPDFSPISRFGIGLLTCFLIADELDIFTKSAESEKAVLLKIKKVHGKYLLKYLSVDKLPETIRKHGTIIQLYVRANVDLTNIEGELKKWILFPNCKISLQLNKSNINIGYNSPAEMLRNHLTEIGYEIDEKTLKIEEVRNDGITLAFALRYIEHWKEWEFLEYRENPRSYSAPIGTCIEGVRVDFNTPGFIGKNLYALVNASGKSAPKTNVARSNIEITPEREQLLSKIYQLYLSHIANEIENLRKGFSITWAANEANWLLNTFSRNIRHYRNKDVRIEDLDSFETELLRVKCVLIENKGGREITSISELKDLGHFWSIDSASYSSANSLIKEIRSSNTSALALLRTLFGEEEATSNHIDHLICRLQFDNTIDDIISNNFQVDAIKIIPEQRRLDMRWSRIKEKIWEEIIISDDDFNRINNPRCYIQLLDFEIDKISQIAINSSNALFILKNSPLNEYLVKLTATLSQDSQDDKITLSLIVGMISRLFNFKDVGKINLKEFMEGIFKRPNNRNLEKIVWERIDIEELILTIQKTNFSKYDTTIWNRRDLF